jgi:Hypervirulence associated proteins TUDOR domain
MMSDCKRGDHVEWNSETERVRGTVKEKVTTEFTFKR